MSFFLLNHCIFCFISFSVHFCWEGDHTLGEDGVAQFLSMIYKLLSMLYNLLYMLCKLLSKTSFFVHGWRDRSLFTLCGLFEEVSSLMVCSLFGGINSNWADMHLTIIVLCSCFTWETEETETGFRLQFLYRRYQDDPANFYSSVLLNFMQYRNFQPRVEGLFVVEQRWHLFVAEQRW